MTPQTASVSFDAFRTIDLRGAQLSAAQLRAAMPRSATASFETVAAQVGGIIDDVRTRGFDALSDLAQRFDDVALPDPRVPAHALAEALEALAPDVRAALEESIDRARRFALAQKPQDIDVDIRPGAVLTQRWVPVGRVGLYVPGGLAVLASSVVMNVVPAQAAGVDSIALASPPQKEFDGLPHPVILAAAALLGIDEVYAIGGAQAVAAFAHGVGGDGVREGIAPVDVVTGPGNIYVATAKRLVKGVVGIDAEAGTTEIAVLADSTGQPRLIAADLISQAEHDPNAASVLITPSEKLAAAVRAELAVQVQATRHRERVETALSGPQSGTILVEDLAQGVLVCDAYAAEHLEVHTAEAAAVAARIRNAGAVFVGEYSPVSLGDYCAGSNHVLPTAGTAAFASGLSVHTFLRAMQVIDYSAEALREVGEHVVNLATAEDLPGHGDAVKVRFEAR